MCEDFIKTLLSKRTDDLLVKAKALTARIEEELSQTNNNRAKGLPVGVDPSKLPKNFKDAMGRVDRTMGRSLRP